MVTNTRSAFVTRKWSATLLLNSPFSELPELMIFIEIGHWNLILYLEENSIANANLQNVHIMNELRKRLQFFVQKSRKSQKNDFLRFSYQKVVTKIGNFGELFSFHRLLYWPNSFFQYEKPSAQNSRKYFFFEFPVKLKLTFYVDVQNVKINVIFFS